MENECECLYQVSGAEQLFHLYKRQQHAVESSNPLLIVVVIIGPLASSSLLE